MWPLEADAKSETILAYFHIKMESLIAEINKCEAWCATILLLHAIRSPFTTTTAVISLELNPI